jgi:hypothetical protein
MACYGSFAAFHELATKALERDVRDIDPIEIAFTVDAQPSEFWSFSHIDAKDPELEWWSLGSPIRGWATVKDLRNGRRVCRRLDAQLRQIAMIEGATVLHGIEGEQPVELLMLELSKVFGGGEC